MKDFDIEKFISLCNKEYEQNGNSAKFVNAENIICKHGKLSDIIKFAENVPNCDKELFTTRILASYNFGQILYFAKNVKGANLLAITQHIIESKSANNMLVFAQQVKNVNLEQIENAIVQTGKGKAIFAFANTFETKNKNKLIDKAIASKDPEILYTLLSNKEFCNKKNFLDAILTSNNGFLIYLAHKKGLISITQAHDSLLASNDKTWLNEFYKMYDLNMSNKFINNILTKYNKKNAVEVSKQLKDAMDSLSK